MRWDCVRLDVTLMAGARCGPAQQERKSMEPDDVIREFERLALDEEVELSADDAIARLAVLLANPAIEGRERELLTEVGATLYRLGMSEGRD